MVDILVLKSLQRILDLSIWNIFFLSIRETFIFFGRNSFLKNERQIDALEYTYLFFILDLQNIRTAYFHKVDICTHSNQLIGTKKFLESTQCAIHCLNYPLCGSFILSPTTNRYKCDIFTRAVAYPVVDCELTENLFEGRSCIAV